MFRTLPRCDFRVLFSGATDIGKIRGNNEDVWKIEPSVALFLICDGMGGQADGEVAAALAAEAFVEAVKGKNARRALDLFVGAPTLENRGRVVQTLKAASQAANQRVLDETKRSEHKKPMGCTLDAVLLLGDRAFTAHLGDSRSYLARSSFTAQLTHDHSLFFTMLAKGLISPSSSPPVPDPLVNAVGLLPEPLVDVASFELTRGDRLLLCTDGVHGVFASAADLGKVLREGNVDEAAQGLLRSASEAGGRDNATAIVIEVAERFVMRSGNDGGWKSHDQAMLRGCSLLTKLPLPVIQRIAASAVEVEFAAGETMPRSATCATVAYLVLGGQVKFPDGRVFGPPALLYPESLVGGLRDNALATAEQPVRALRWRADDFRDLCSGDAPLAAALYERLARLLAR